ncbi:MAG: hypothetical protein NZ959_09255 [Armatimonadetes bacterium]|nr:hypothetical protein [Armatimonadota bacterium]
MVLSLYPAVIRWRLAPAEIAVMPKRLRPGEKLTASYRQRIKRDASLRQMIARFVFRETATYWTKNGKRIVTQDFVLDEKTLFFRFPLIGGTLLEQVVEFTVPKETMHTFRSRNNRLEYFVVFQVELKGWVDDRYRAEVEVIAEPPRDSG